MQKFTKRFAVIVMALIATVCLAVFAAACKDGGDGETYATESFTVTVLDENGNAINGTTFSVVDVPVKIQFCDAENTSGCATPVAVGTDGKATINMETTGLKGLGASTVELHVQNLDAKYKVEYGQYPINKIPLNITVTLELA